MSIKGEGCKGSKVESEFYFPGDPEYIDTARILAESGLALALEVNKICHVREEDFKPCSRCSPKEALYVRIKIRIQSCCERRQIQNQFQILFDHEENSS